MRATKLTALLSTLALCAGVLFGAGTAYAAEAGAIAIDAPGAELSVQNVWITEDDTLHIQVTDARIGVNQTLGLNLRDYAGVSDEYVSVQAVDRDGNKSNTIQFKNPYYVESTAVPGASEPIGTIPADPGADSGGIPSGASDGAKTLTPDGTGSVVDNVHDGDGKEFFSIKTEDGNVFYLIVDRQRTSDNVYLLNAVTENDLASLAKPGDGMGGGIPTVTPANTGEQPASTVTAAPEPSDPPAKANSGGINGGALIFIVIAALAVGGAGYYFKILKPKKDAAGDDSEDYDEPDADAEYDDYDGDSDEGEDADHGGTGGDSE